MGSKSPNTHSIDRPSNMDPKLSVSTDKELLKLGNDVIELADESTAAYHTDDIMQFIEFCKGKVVGGDYALFYGVSSVSLYHQHVFVNPRIHDPIAICSMAEHPRLSMLVRANGSPMDVEDFEVLLRRLRANMGQPGLEILDKIRDLSVAKVQKVERKKNRATGDYHYLVSRQSAGEGDYVPPETVKFSVPIFLGVESPRSLEFDFSFDPKQKDDGVALIFSIENINLGEDLDAARRSVLAEVLSPLSIPSYWGELKRDIKTDAWSKKINGPQL